MIYVLTGLALVILLFVALSVYAFLMATWRKFPVTRGNTSPEVAGCREKHKDDIEKAREYAYSLPWEFVEIKSFDGLTLRARLLPSDDNKRAVILAHGYRSHAIHDMACVMEYYQKAGYTILAPDLRGHGKSDGSYITFGTLDRFDINSWCKYINERIAPRDLILDGVSMGAASVLMSLGTDLPENVRAAIADCGFTGAWDEFSHMMKHSFRIPKFPVLYIASLISRVFAGWGFRDYDAPTALKRNTRIPVFFAHGESDSFVPPWMTTVNFESCASEKELFTVPGAGHGESWLAERDQYEKLVTEFLDRYLTEGDES